MNGIFTEAESARLNVEERIHYLSVGLCAPVMAREIEHLTEQLLDNERESELEDEIDRVRDLLSTQRSEHDDLLVRVDQFMQYLVTMPLATADEIRKKARELF